MRGLLSLLLLVLLFAEITGFILVGQAIGVLPTLSLILLGLVAGAILVRRQGLVMLMRARTEFAAGRLPARQLAEGAVRVGAALLIMLPGFISDIIGISLFIPAVRSLLWRALSRRFAFRGRGRPSHHTDGVLDLDRGEFSAIPRPGSPWRKKVDHQA
jgi:UPF0716 protein FxsA